MLEAKNKKLFASEIDFDGKCLLREVNKYQSKQITAIIGHCFQ